MQKKSSEGRHVGPRHVWRVGGALLALAAVFAAASPGFADEQEHHHGEQVTRFDGELLLWGSVSLGGLFLLLAVTRFLLGRQPAGQGCKSPSDVPYITAIRQFSPNARLFLTYSILSELGSGIWAVMFNLYLLRVGFPISFVGTFWLVNMLCHGSAALPAGLIADRFGRRRAFFVATLASLIAQGSLLFTMDPLAILILAGLAGFGDAFHGVTGAPFMMENSEASERPHLFSLNACFLQFSRFVGSFSGGVLPLAWAALLGVPAVEPGAARWALVSGLPLTLLALTPLAFMREKPVELVESFKDLISLRNVVHFDVIARFTLLSLMVGTGFGLTIRFFNVFFQDARQASDTEVGTILALAAIASSGSILIAPALAQSWGKARGLMVTQALSVPFLLLMALTPSLATAMTFFLVRGALYSIGQPLRNQLSMEFISSRERGTTAGFTHTAFDLGGGAGAGLAGLLIADGGFVESFSAAAVLILVPAVLYYVFFHRMESFGRQQQAVLAGAATSAGG